MYFYESSYCSLRQIYTIIPKLPNRNTRYEIRPRRKITNVSTLKILYKTVRFLFEKCSIFHPNTFLNTFRIPLFFKNSYRILTEHYILSVIQLIISMLQNHKHQFNDTALQNLTFDLSGTIFVTVPRLKTGRIFPGPLSNHNIAILADRHIARSLIINIY